MHLWLVVDAASAHRPFPGKIVDPQTYDAEYHEELKRGVPFLGDAMLQDMLFSAFAVIVVVIIAAIVGPKGPSGPPDPTLSGANPRPEWPFLWLFALLSLSPPTAETFIMLVLPVVLVVALAAGAVRQQSRGARSQPPAGCGAVGDCRLRDAGSPDIRRRPRSLVAGDDAWTGRSHSQRDRQARSTPVELQGALVFQYKNCRNCHALDGVGGRRGPDLTHGRHPDDAKSTHRSGQQRHAGRRQHAGLRISR